MAFACVRHLDCRITLQQGERMSSEKIRTAFAARQSFLIMRDMRSKQRYALPSKTTPETDRICWILGLPLSRTPYWME